jgi:hypothetical protein
MFPLLFLQSLLKGILGTESRDKKFFLVGDKGVSPHKKVWMGLHQSWRLHTPSEDDESNMDHGLVFVLTDTS